MIDAGLGGGITCDVNHCCGSMMDPALLNGHPFYRGNRRWFVFSRPVLTERCYDYEMTMSQIHSAIERQIPFSLLMADGKSYHVPHPDYITVPPKGAFVVVFDDAEHAYVLPLLTMTGLTYDSSKISSD